MQQFAIKPFLPSIIVFAIVLSAFLFDSYVASFDYNKSAIVSGEYWRIITGHFFHTNYNHMLLNVAGLAMLTALHNKFYTTTNYVLLYSFSAAFISIALLISSPLSHYVGLSGVLHALFAWGALKDIQHKEKTGYLLFIGLWLKIGHEQIYGASDSVSALINANVAIDAHLWGAIAGSLFFTTSLLKRSH